MATIHVIERKQEAPEPVPMLMWPFDVLTSVLMLVVVLCGLSAYGSMGSPSGLTALVGLMAATFGLAWHSRGKGS